MSSTVANYGQIKQMSIPADWLEQEHEPEPYSSFYLREFLLPQNPEVKIALYYRGRPIDTTSASNFQAALQKESHQLTEEELKPISLVLRNMSAEGAFEKQYARTENLNGKQVLTIKGRWNKSGLVSLGIFVDAEGTGRVIQEIYYVAPDTEYDRYAELAMSALNSIEWKPGPANKQ